MKCAAAVRVYVASHGTFTLAAKLRSHTLKLCRLCVGSFGFWFLLHPLMGRLLDCLPGNPFHVFGVEAPAPIDYDERQPAGHHPAIQSVVTDAELFTGLTDG